MKGKYLKGRKSQETGTIKYDEKSDKRQLILHIMLFVV